MSKQLFFKRASFFSSYEDGTSYEDKFITNKPLQDGMELFHILEERQKIFQVKNNLTEPIVNQYCVSIGVVVGNFIDESEAVQFDIFDNSNIKNNKLRKTVYNIKNKYGNKTIKGCQSGNVFIRRR